MAFLSLDRRHASWLVANLSNNGWIFSSLLRFEMRAASATLKNCGATSVNHFGSMTVTCRQYSLVVRSNSW